MKIFGNWSLVSLLTAENLNQVSIMHEEQKQRVQVWQSS